MGVQLGDAGRLRLLFLRALELNPEERAGFLKGPDFDEETREELKALLDADQGSETFLRDIVAGDRLVTPGVGERFGAYETKELLGRGGMGVVFRAERIDGELSQTVAVKIIRHSWLDPRALDRF